jgi:hypothetical protein
MNTIQRAVEAAAQYVEDQSLAPDEARLTLPSVAVEQGRQNVVMAYHLGQNRPSGPREPRKIYFPFLEVRVNLPDLEPSARQIDSGDFGIILPAREYLGDLGDLLRFDMDAYSARQERFEELLSTVADQAWLLKRGKSPQESDTARELSEVLRDISEAALEPYYAVSMGDLRRWLAECGHPFQKRSQ